MVSRRIAPRVVSRRTAIGGGSPRKPAALLAPGGRGPGTPAVPYWGKYVYHDNNRDINLSQMSMRAITDWYFTAHPPIMHDLHEAQPLLYTYSGGPPQNPNLDPLLFAELPFFSNWELSQMTKWGMPGVYTFAFMDGWSPGYLGSVAYNHNGMMRMYETQSGRDVDVDSVRAAWAKNPPGVAAAGGGFGGGGGPGNAANRPRIPTGRGGGQDREWYRGIPIPEGGVNAFTRRNNTNYMETGVLSALQLTSMFPNLVLQNFYVKTRNSLEEGKTRAPYAYVFPVQRDMTRVMTLIGVLRAQGIEVGRLSTDYKKGSDTISAGGYVVKLDQPYGRLARNLLEKQDYPDAALTTYDDSGWSMGYAFNVETRPIADKAILDAKVTPVDRAEWQGMVAGNGTAGLAVAHYGSNNMITFRYRLKNLAMQVAESSFTAGGTPFPAGSFLVTGTPAELQSARKEVEALGLTAAALDLAYPPYGPIPPTSRGSRSIPSGAAPRSWAGIATRSIASRSPSISSTRSAWPKAICAPTTT